MPKIKKGLTLLHSLDAAEVSLVPEGANRRRFMIFKSAAEGDTMPQKDLLEKIKKADPEVMKKVEHAMKAYAAKMKKPSALDDDESEEGDDASEVEKDGALAGEEGDHEGVLDPQAEAAMKAVVRILIPFKDKISPEMLHEVLEAADFSLKKEGAYDEGESEEDEDSEEDQEGAGESGAFHNGDGRKMASFKAIPESVEGVEKAHMDGAVEAAHGAYKAHLEKLGYQKYPAAEMAMKTTDGDAVMKEKGEHVSKSANGTPDLSTVDPKTRRVLESVFKSNEDLMKANKELVQKNADIEKRVKASEEAAREKEIVAKAASFAHVALPSAEIVATLKDADKLGKESYERICKNFETLNEQGKASRLFGEFGSNQPGVGGSAENAWGKIEKAAEGYVAKSGLKVTKAEAVTAFLETAEGQKMYAEHQAGRKDGI